MTNSLAIAPKNVELNASAEYERILDRVQAHVRDTLDSDVDNTSMLQLKEHIYRFVISKNLRCEIAPSAQELTDFLYHDMAGYSFITREKLFDIPNFEELNVNSWDDVDIKVAGKTKKTNYSFLSPAHAFHIHLRMLRKSGNTMDDSKPRAIADLGKNIRICVEKAPIVDQDVSIASSIRLVRAGSISREELLKWGTATEEMIDFLLLCLRHGVSVCVSGETGSGKTTLAGALCAIVAEELRTVTIEEGSREWDFRKKVNGRYMNSVVHLKTRPHDDPRMNITQETLVKDSMRLDPDFLPIGEIRGEEAFEVMGASNTGHTVLTTIHSNSTQDTPMRLITLAKKAYDMSDATLLSMAVTAFPVLVHIDICADNKRRVTEISEVLEYTGAIVRQTPLFQHHIEDNIRNEDGSITVEGEFKRVGGISERLMQRMLKKGASRVQINRFRER